MKSEDAELVEHGEGGKKKKGERRLTGEAPKGGYEKERKRTARMRERQTRSTKKKPDHTGSHMIAPGVKLRSQGSLSH